MNLDPLGKLESALMETMWADAPATAREVHDRVEGSRAYTTIMTTMDRLHAKGLLLREKDGLAWRYRPAVDKQAYERLATEHHVEQILDAHGEVALNAFVDAADRASSLEHLAAIIEARRAGRT